MQKCLKMMFAFWISVMFVTPVDAAKTCSTSEQAEINSQVSNMRGAYQEMEEPLDPNDYVSPNAEDNEPADVGEVNPNDEEILTTLSYFDISITNMTDKFYLVVTNDYDDEKQTFYYSDAKDGIITFPWYNLDAVTTFTIEVYTSNNTGCPNELQRTITVRTPRYNEFYESVACEENPKFNLCQKFVTFDYIESGEFQTRLDAYLKVDDDNADTPKEKDKNTLEEIKDFVANNKYYFIGGGIAILVIAGVVIAVIVRKQRSSEL